MMAQETNQTHADMQSQLSFSFTPSTREVPVKNNTDDKRMVKFAHHICGVLSHLARAVIKLRTSCKQKPGRDKRLWVPRRGVGMVCHIGQECNALSRRGDDGLVTGEWQGRVQLGHAPTCGHGATSNSEKN